ncbi:hypothetical protein Cpin_0643 [Chitinophaga pinensis DSM 2588]|uniref:Uncharacterized protein n=1 Tax=Chitinophaga pinensis (strain ATCC 43595 / DSM 2588 / LMG 13176 / NBRC 15968 / NCIMB 11800 / UQM 2034) TaxID=485918 RepID=A0A979FZX6_CHIPD|nr:hypothetical protein Cpin_0643 [Chitinophaga pinensis DSM 2588]
MDTVFFRLYYSIDSLYRYNMFNDAGSNVSNLTTNNAEPDSYAGKVSFPSTQTLAQITLSMKRVSFGICYNVSNFNSGRLLVDFARLMPAKAFPTTWIFQSNLYILPMNCHRLIQPNRLMSI